MIEDIRFGEPIVGSLFFLDPSKDADNKEALPGLQRQGLFFLSPLTLDVR